MGRNYQFKEKEIEAIQAERKKNKYHAGAQRHEGRKRIGGKWYNEEYGTRPVFLCRKKRAKQIGNMLSR